MSVAVAELACTYATLILHDDGISVTSEKIVKLLKAANVTVESYWPTLFAKLVEKKNLDDLIFNAASSGSGATATAAATAGAGAGASLAVTTLPVEENKEEIKEESDDEFMLDLFG